MLSSILRDFQPNWEPYVDRSLLINITLLIGLGLVVMTSASIAHAERLYDNQFFFLQRQLIFLCLGVFAAAMVYKIRTQFWQAMGSKLLLVIVLFLVAVLIPGIGKSVNGSYRWIDLGLFSIQVSEIAKLVMILYLASYLVKHGKALSASENYKSLFIPLILIGLTDALLILEPDFGSVVVLTATGIAMLFLGGVSISRLILLFFATVLALIPLLMMGYRGERVKAFLDPWSHASGKAYQTVHALMAVGDGGWFGAGLGASVQKLFYLPEAHNDFVFAVLAEEFGFMGMIITLFLYGWLVQRAFSIGFAADKAKLHFSAYISYGIGFWIGFQVLFHIGVNLAILPPKGLTLPFISYGGSSLLIMMISMGLLMRVHRDTHIALYGMSEREVRKAKSSRAKKTNKRLKAKRQNIARGVLNG